MTGRESCESRTATLSSTAGRHAQVAFAGMRTSRSRVMRTYSSHPARKIRKKIAVTDRRRFFARNGRRNPIGGASKSINLLYVIEHEIRWIVALNVKTTRRRLSAGYCRIITISVRPNPQAEIQLARTSAKGDQIRMPLRR